MGTSPVIIISVKGVHVHVLSVHKDILGGWVTIKLFQIYITPRVILLRCIQDHISYMAVRSCYDLEQYASLALTARIHSASAFIRTLDI